MFNKLIDFILKLDKSDFKHAAEQLRVFIDEMKITDFKFVVKQIGTIPEIIEHDSTEEKLYSKASDIVLARCFRELGLAARAANPNSLKHLARTISEALEYSFSSVESCSIISGMVPICFTTNLKSVIFISSINTLSCSAACLKSLLSSFKIKSISLLNILFPPPVKYLTQL